MVCSYCFHKTEVINSRLQKRTNSVWRRRNCLSCGVVFSSIEQIDYEKTWVVQYSDGTSLPFLRDRILLSIYKSCGHRPQATQDSISLTRTVLGHLQDQVANGNGTVTARTIASTIHIALRHFDMAAAVHYKAFHQDSLAK